MALIKCKECGHEISKSAKNCPNCGAKRKKSSAGCLVFIILGFLFFGYFASIDTSSYSSPSINTSTTTSTSTTEDFGPKLVLIDWNWSHQSSFAIVEGQVKNISDQPLDNVKAVVEFYTGDDVFISSDNSLIEYKPLMPGQTSPFKIIESWNPQMESAKINFTTLYGRQISWKKK